MSNLAKVYAIQKSNEERFLKINKDIPHDSGIYILYRFDENGFKYAYVGQARDLLKRLGQHLSGYNQHIDRSLKKHKLYNIENPYGWRVKVYKFPIDQLDDKEREYIKICADNGFQLRNITLGGQNVGKSNIAENKASKTYRDGIKQGESNTKKDIQVYFQKYLQVDVQKNNKICNKKLEQFKQDYLGEQT